MKPATAKTALRVQDHLGPGYRVLEFEESTRSAADAAAAIGCPVAAIAKSLVFRQADGAPVLVIASGTNRVDEARVAAVLGQPIGRADADFVREHTGYAIGGVAPVGHPAPIRTLLDRDLLALPEIWAAAGTPNAVFRMTPAQLEALTGGEVADVAKLP
ncbi:MAG: prolyl-tRNA editing protein [Gammaproteobacteria bacterium]|nr:prolyl-tRNA editing protein [Gammaproteobacteria bacterium]